MKKAIVRTAEWTNGIGIRVQGAYQFDEENKEFVFRIIGRDDDFTLPAEPIICNAEDFVWLDS